MKVLVSVSIALILAPLCGVASPARAGGFAKSPGAAEVLEQLKYEPVRLPLSAKAARTWISLRETLVKPPPDKTTMADIIRLIKESTRGKDGKGTPPKVYVDPVSLQMAEVTMTTPIAAPFLVESEVSLHTYLEFALRPLGLAHRVHDDLIVIDSPCDDCPEPVAVSAERAWAWLLLHEEIPLHFPDGTTLGDALKTIQRATLGKRSVGRGIVLYLDPIGLQAIEKTPALPVTFDMDGVPLCTSFGLFLRQEGLIFVVGDDGIIQITSPEAGIQAEFTDEADAIEGYQSLRYDYFGERVNQGREIEQPKASKTRTRDRAATHEH